MSSRELTPDDLPDGLSPERRQLLVDLGRLWLRQTDLRFGQLLRTTASTPDRRPEELTDALVREGTATELERVPDRPPPPGPYWDTLARGHGSFMNGCPRDPVRIPALLIALARAWATKPDLSIGQLLEHALEQSGIPENEFGTRWLLVEDVPLQRILANQGATARRRGPRGQSSPGEAS